MDLATQGNQAILIERLCSVVHHDHILLVTKEHFVNENRIIIEDNGECVLNSTSKQDYEKKAEIKSKITGLMQKLQSNEKELTAKVEKCIHLKERVNTYKIYASQIDRRRARY